MKKFKRYASAFGALLGAAGFFTAVKLGIVDYWLADTKPEQLQAITSTIGVLSAALGIAVTKFVAYFFDNDPNTP